MIYVLMSSLNSIDAEEWTFVAAGDRGDLKNLSANFGVKSWTLCDGYEIAMNGRIKIMPVPTWRCSLKGEE